MIVYITPLLTKERLAHTLGVERAALALAARYGLEERAASAAALLHDCAKDMTAAQMREILSSCGEKADVHEAQLHGTASAALAARDMGVSDAQVLGAIRYHTTGRAHMGLLEKVIYVADMIEEGHTYDGVDEQRSAAHQDIDEAMRLCLESTITYVLKRRKSVCVDSVAAWNALIE